MAETGRGSLLELERFDPVQVRNQLAYRFDVDDVPDDLVEMVSDHTGGNPLFVDEITRHLAEIVGNEPANLPSSLDSISLPETVEQTVSQRIEVVDAQARTVLELGAIIGETFSLDVLVAASDLSRSDILECTDYLVNRHIWHHEHDEIAFVHGVVREQTLETIDEDDRKSFHLDVAAAIERVYEASLDGHYGRLATHYERGDQYKTAVEYYHCAGKQAVDAYAYETAIGHYEAAVSTARIHSICESADTVQLLIALTELYKLTGQYDRMKESIEAGLQLVFERSREQCQLLGLKIAAHRGRSEYEEAKQIADRLLELTEAINAADIESDARYQLGTIAMKQGEYQEAREYFDEALLLANEIDDAETEAKGWKSIGSVLYFQGEYEQAREHYERSLELFRTIDDRASEGAVLNNLGIVAGFLGDTEQTRTYYEQSLDIAREIGDRKREATVLNNLGELAREERAYEEAREYYEQSLDIKRDLGDRHGEATTLHNLALVISYNSEYDTARQYLLDCLEIVRDIDDKEGEAAALAQLSTISFKRGYYNRASEFRERSFELREELGDRFGLIGSYTGLGQLATEREQYDQAWEYYNDAIEIARELEQPDREVACLEGMGRLARKEHDFDTAREKLDAALQILGDLDDSKLSADIRFEYAALELECVNLEEARTHLEEAHRRYDDLGMTHEIACCQRLRGRTAARENQKTAALEHWRDALKTFEGVGAPHDILQTLRNLVETCREQGDEQQASEWRDRATQIFQDAPESVKEQHLEWMEREDN